MIPSEAWLRMKIGSLSGKTVLVTGGNSGIGFEACRALLFLGAKVIGVCRDEAKAKEALAAIRLENPEADFSFRYYDQSSPESIEGLAKGLVSEHLDAIVLNAGIYFPKKGATAQDGSSLTFATNARGSFLLWKALYPSHPSARYVVVNSIANEAPKDHDFAPYLQAGFCSRSTEYFVSKRACMSLVGYALSHSDCDITLTHPGVTRSNILRDYAPWIKKAGNAVLYLFCHKSWKACLGIVYLASGKGKRGSYAVPRGLWQISGYPKLTHLPLKKVFGDSENLANVLAQGERC